MRARHWLLAVAVFPAANAVLFWTVVFRTPRGGPLSLVVCAAAVLVEVILVGCSGSKPSWAVRAAASIVIVTLTVVGIVAYLVVSLAGVDCPPNAYECPL
jgi:hypothetical protein